MSRGSTVVTKGVEDEFTQVVYHLHGMTVWFMVWANVKEFEKQNKIWHVLFTEIYSGGLELSYVDLEW